MGSFKKSLKVVCEVVATTIHIATALYMTPRLAWRKLLICIYPLATGRGNGGNIDGDSQRLRGIQRPNCRQLVNLCSAIRRITRLTQPRIDESEQYPVILSTLFPALLCNGTRAIAVGMADTSIDMLIRPDIPIGGTISKNKGDVEDV